MLNACTVIVTAEMKKTWILLKVHDKNDCKDDWFL